MPVRRAGKKAGAKGKGSSKTKKKVSKRPKRAARSKGRGPRGVCTKGGPIIIPPTMEMCEKKK